VVTIVLAIVATVMKDDGISTTAPGQIGAENARTEVLVTTEVTVMARPSGVVMSAGAIGVTAAMDDAIGAAKAAKVKEIAKTAAVGTER
jgi:hypothetical protein